MCFESLLNILVTMTSLPKINVTTNIEDDIRLFLRFLNHPDYPGKRQVVLNFYPTLSEQLLNVADEITIVNEYVEDMYKRHAPYIDTITKAFTEEVEASGRVFNVLSEVMHYPTLGEDTYIARTTFLPFSPLTDDGFYFSLARLPQNTRRLLFTAVHEISHHVLLGQLHDWERNTGISLNKPAKHYLKEAITGAIMDNPKFCQYFNYRELFNEDTYKGNVELHDFMLQLPNITSVNIVAYVKQKLLTDENTPYVRKLQDLFVTFSNNQEVFTNQWRIWNAYQIESNSSKILENYRKPVVFKK